MKLWKLLKKNKDENVSVPSAPAVPSPLRQELERIDAIEAYSPKSRKKAYWSTLHPMVQASYVYHVDWELEKTLPMTSDDARQVFRYWGYPVNYSTAAVTERQKQLMTQYGYCKEFLWQQHQKARLHFEEIDKQAKAEQAQLWADYRDYLALCPEDIQKQVAYELARRGSSEGHYGLRTRFSPFRVCGWADYVDPDWPDFPAQGVAFHIEDGCFSERKPTLYYCDDDRWPGDRQEKAFALIRKYSSGIGNVRLETWTETDRWGDPVQKVGVLFDLDPAAIKPEVMLSGETVTTSDVGQYIFVLPRAGEFYCQLGEIREGERICLHKDDFCMK